MLRRAWRVSSLGHPLIVLTMSRSDGAPSFAALGTLVLPAPVLSVLAGALSGGAGGESAAVPSRADLLRALQAVVARRDDLRLEMMYARSMETALGTLLADRGSSAIRDHHANTVGDSEIMPMAAPGAALRSSTKRSFSSGQDFQEVPVSPRADDGASSSAAPDTVAAQDLLLRVAAAGLAGKLCLHAIPELCSLMESLDSLVAAGVRDPVHVSRAWLLLRGVRGHAGVRWLCTWLLDRMAQWTESWDLGVAEELLVAFAAQCQSEHGGQQSWACHNEGRHAGLSGGHFLRALCTAEGFDGLDVAVSRVWPVVRRVLEGDTSLSSDCWVDVAHTLAGTIVFSGSPSVRRVGMYNSMDFARGLAAWGAHSFGISADEVSDRLWDSLVRRQQAGDAESVLDRFDARVFFGLSSASEANAFLARLRACARLPSAADQSITVTWIGLLVFLCEMRPVLACSSLGLAGVEKLLCACAEDYMSAVLQFDAVYRRSVSFGRQCHLVRLFLTAQLAVESARQDRLVDVRET